VLHTALIDHSQQGHSRLRRDQLVDPTARRPAAQIFHGRLVGVLVQVKQAYAYSDGSPAVTRRGVHLR
jgi:hypothetical protein